MSNTWWNGLRLNGLTPKGVQSTLNRAIQIKDEHIAELEHKLKQERKAHEKDIYVWQDNYAALETKLEKAVTALKFYRIDELEAKLEEAVESLEKLARLGNGDLYGNSDGNMIARITLAKLKGDKQ